MEISFGIFNGTLFLLPAITITVTGETEIVIAWLNFGLEIRFGGQHDRIRIHKKHAGH